MRTVRCVVDNRVLLLGLDKIYRDAMKEHERTELLECARRVADALNSAPAEVPIEGYYAEDELLTEYFRLVRSLQDIDATRTSQVNSLKEFKRLLDVTSSPLYGRAQYNDKLLPVGRDALSQALIDTMPNWTVPGLTTAAYDIALKNDDISLVGLASLAKDAIVLTALRESVVLYAEMVLGAVDPPRLEYVWRVDQELERRATRFITTFNSLFGESLPAPGVNQAERYWHACEKNELLYRCARIGLDDTLLPTQHYHWCVFPVANDQWTVREFWTPDVWTTQRLRSAMRGGEKFPWL